MQLMKGWNFNVPFVSLPMNLGKLYLLKEIPNPYLVKKSIFYHELS